MTGCCKYMHELNFPGCCELCHQEAYRMGFIIGTDKDGDGVCCEVKKWLEAKRTKEEQQCHK